MERYAIYALVALLAFGSIGAVGYHRGHANATQDCALERAASIERATAQAREIALQDAEISAGFEITRTRIQTVYRDKTVEVVREITPDCMQCGLGPDGLRLINAIRRGELPAVSGQPDGGLPPTADAPIGPSPGARQINAPGQPNVLRLRDAAQLAGRPDQSAGI